MKLKAKIATLISTTFNYTYDYVTRSSTEATFRPLDEKANIPGQNVSRLLEQTFKHYDKRIRPYYGGEFKERVQSKDFFDENTLFLCL